MGSGKIQSYELGKVGVVLDVQPLDPGLPGAGLATAQNATPDLTTSRAGGIRKRSGLKRVGNAPLAGPVLGGIGVPLAVKAVSINNTPIGLGLIGATSASDTSGTVSTGVVSGSPGGDDAASGATSTGGSTGSPDGVPINTVPTLFMALRMPTITSGDMGKSAGWLVGIPNGDGTFRFFHGIGGVAGDGTTGYTDSNYMNNARSKQMPAGQIQNFFSAFCGSPSSAAVSGGALLYPSGKYANPNGGVLIDRLDTTAQKLQNGKALLGYTNATICNLGNLLGATYGVVMSMVAQDDFNLWVTTYDDDNAFGAKGGRLYWLNPLNGATRLIKTFSGEIPYSLCIHNGLPWVGTVFAAGSHGIIYRGTLDPKGTGTVTDMTADHTATADKVMTLVSFQGRLFAGESGTPGKIEVRSSLGVWSVSSSLAATSSDLFIGAALEFNGALYVSTFDSTPAKAAIQKFDGTTWTTVKTAFTAPPLTSAWIHNGVLFFAGGGANTNFNQALMILSTTDGSSYTDLSSSFTDAASGVGLETGVLAPLPITGIVNIPVPVSQ